MKINKISAIDSIKYYGMSKDNLKKLGIEYHHQGKYKTLKDVRESTDGMVIGESTISGTIDLGNTKLQLTKGAAVVMPLGQYMHGKKNRIYKPYKVTFKEVFKRYKGEDLTNKKLLIWRTGGLGDIIVAQSVCKAIKDKYPTCKITFATSDTFANIFYSWPTGLIDGVAQVPFNYSLLKEHDYHLTFIHAVENCEETRSMNFYDIFQKVTGLDYNANDFVSTLIPIKNVTNSVARFVPVNTIVFHMNASTRLRHAFPSFWVETAKKLITAGFKIGIIDAPNNAAEIAKTISKLPLPKDSLINLAALSRDVNYAVAICNLAVGGICVDSAIGHMFGALRKPGVTLCGPYTPLNITEKYPTVTGICAPPDWNECGKYPCNYNSQEMLCPFIAGNQPVGCMRAITSEEAVKAFLFQMEKCNEKRL